MTIQKKLFSVFTNNFNSDEIKSVKSHLNTLIMQFTGNKLRTSKLDKMFSMFAGAQNPNTLAAEIQAKAPTLDKFANFLSENCSLIFDDIGFCFNLDVKNENVNFLVPVAKYDVITEDGVTRHFNLVLEVCSCKTQDRVTFVQSAAFYDIDEEDYIEMPDRWDLTMNGAEYFFEEYMEIGRVISSSITDESKKLLSMDILLCDFNDMYLLQNVSMALAIHTSSVLEHISEKKVRMNMLYTTEHQEINLDNIHAYEVVF